jgi:hypothetical protein
VSTMDTPRQDPRGHLVRPYTVTRGRTGSDREFALESLFRATRQGLRGAASAGRDRLLIIQLCTEQVQSLAELSAHLGRPLGVTRVLVGELVDLGFLDIEEAADGVDGELSVALLERVLSGLHNL